MIKGVLNQKIYMCKYFRVSISLTGGEKRKPFSVFCILNTTFYNVIELEIEQ